MATTISNPASFSSVRSAFNTEGYGISTSFFAYRQGGGIVPSSSAFNVIGAGTGGDPLRLSQFSGFTVPSLALDTFTLTAKSGTMTPTKGPSSSIYGYMGADYEIVAGSASIPGSSLSDTTFSVTGSRIDALYWDAGAYGSGFFTFAIDGGYSNSGWTTLSIYHTYSGATTNFTRSSMNYGSYSGQTSWNIDTMTNPFSNTTTGQNSYEITIS